MPWIGGIGIQRGHQVCQLVLRRLGRQRVLDGVEAAFLGHAALGTDIGVARRIVADNDDRKAQSSRPGRLLERCLAAIFTASITEAAAPASPSIDRREGHRSAHPLEA